MCVCVWLGVGTKIEIIAPRVLRLSLHLPRDNCDVIHDGFNGKVGVGSV